SRLKIYGSAVQVRPCPLRNPRGTTLSRGFFISPERPPGLRWAAGRHRRKSLKGIPPVRAVRSRRGSCMGPLAAVLRHVYALGASPDDGDGALLARARSGDSAAFAALVRRHGPMVY